MFKATLEALGNAAKAKANFVKQSKGKYLTASALAGFLCRSWNYSNYDYWWYFISGRFTIY